jgi:hypothetical protein
MAKSKETDETVTPETQAKADAESVVVAENPVPEVKSKKRKYKLLGGKYHTSTKVYKVGDIVESDDDMVAIWGRPKFELLEG